ncbi:MAG TPA: alpha-xylosidase [Lachnospiraceae bacterium]|nr:alpha-xylosidase [Lachnospiraceae bacterium]
MIFGNGCWLQKEGCGCFSPQEVYFEKIEDTKVTLCLPTSKIFNRGCTLGGINLTMVITSPAQEVFRVQTYHHLGTMQKGPEFELYQKEELPIEVTEDQETLQIKSGSLTLEIGKKDWSMVYKRNGELITKSAAQDLACMKTDWKGDYYDRGDISETYMRQQLSMGVGELIYGLGERFTAFVKNGQSVKIWNEDGGTSTYQSYKNIPFYISNKGYGVFVNHPEKVEFEVGTEQVSKTSFSVEGGYLDYYLFNGPTMKEVLLRYTELTGKPSLPAPWTFGLWLSTSFTTNYNEATVMSFVDGMLDRGIPLRTFHFDCFWMKEFHWTDFTWDSRVFPDPAGMLSRIKAKGLNICVWINSYIAQESCTFKEGMEKGYFVKRTDGDVWQWDMWQPGMALVDFTNPEACKWYQDKLAVLLDMGVDCFKTDFGERIPVDGIEYYDHSDPKKMHNYYAYLYNKIVYDVLEKKRGKGQAVLFARSATVGGQRFPVHWGGDCWSDYESMEQSLRGGLSLLMSGFGFWAHDIGGFESTSTPDVYKRWVAFGLLSSHSRLHGSTSYRVPWVYDEEAVDVLRFFTKLKARLMPYLYKTAIQANRQGIPTMRSMVLEFTEDRTCHYVERQYMLGDNLLVAPIFNEEGMGDFYLPAGNWTDFITGEEMAGGRWIRQKYNYLSIPLMVKENSIIALGAQDDKPDYDYGNQVELRIYGLQDGASASTVVYGMDQKEEVKVTAHRDGSRITVDVEAGKPYTIRLVNRNASGAEGAVAVIDHNDTILQAANGHLVATL